MDQSIFTWRVPVRAGPGQVVSRISPSPSFFGAFQHVLNGNELWKTFAILCTLFPFTLSDDYGDPGLLVFVNYHQYDIDCFHLPQVLLTLAV